MRAIVCLFRMSSNRDIIGHSRTNLVNLFMRTSDIVGWPNRYFDSFSPIEKHIHFHTCFAVIIFFSYTVTTLLRITTCLIVFCPQHTNTEFHVVTVCSRVLFPYYLFVRKILTWYCNIFSIYFQLIFAFSYLDIFSDIENPFNAKHLR